MNWRDEWEDWDKATETEKNMTYGLWWRKNTQVGTKTEELESVRVKSDEESIYWAL